MICILQTLIFSAGMLWAGIYDIRYRLVDDRVCWMIALAGLGHISPASFLGAFLGALPFYLGAGFGLNGAGDIFLAAAAGFVLGIPGTILGMGLFAVIYSLYVTMVSLCLWLAGKPIPRSYPLVPFITAGFLPVYFLF